MFQVKLNNSWINKVISEKPYIKLLSIPKFNKRENRYEAVAQFNNCLALIEVNVIMQENQ